MYRGTFAIVDLSAIRANVAAIRQRLSRHTHMLVSVKAGGYGHGAVEAAEAALAGGADYLGVASLEEAIALRQGGTEAPILVFGAVSPQAAIDAARYRVDVPLVDDWSQWDIPVYDPPLRVHIKVETGMHRLGLQAPQDVAKLARWLRVRPDIELVGLFTHLASADDADTTPTLLQAERFQAFLAVLEAEQMRPPIVHAANSAGALRFSDLHYNLVRVGISAYGYLPSSDFETDVELRPALNVYSFVTRVATVDAGEPVGYGGAFVTPRPSRIATVPIGYADGFPRWLSNRGTVIVKGKPAPIVGRVCMDQCMVDVTDLDDVAVGDCVTVYGRYAPPEWRADEFVKYDDAGQRKWLVRGFQAYSTRARLLSLDTVAAVGGTISYELMCALSSRVPRIYA